MSARSRLDPMRLSQIANRLGAAGARLLGPADPEVTGIALHSKRVRAGDLFVAIPGSRTDGTEFVAEAQRRGAVAVIAEHEVTGVPIPTVVVPSARAAAADAAAAVFRDPARSMTALGVTGTNGKTTTVSLLRWILEKDRRPCALLGTLGFSFPGRELATANTTPDAVLLQGFFRELLDAGVPYCAMEVSSIALDQERVRGVRFSVAVFTNLTGDHLDYHKTFERYLLSKKQLFDGLDARAVAVGNAEDPHTAKVFAGTRARKVLFGMDGGSFPSGAPDVMARVLRADAD